MRLGVFWATPKELDPNLYLRNSILSASNNKITVIELDNTIKLGKRTWLDVDGVVIIGTMLNPQLALIDLLHSSRKLPIVFWDVESPYDADINSHWYRYFDHVFSVEKQSTTAYSFNKISYLPLAADPMYFFQEINLKSAKSISVIGSDYHPRRRLTTQLELLLKDGEFIDRVGAQKKSHGANVRVHERLSPGQISLIDNKARVSLIIGRDFDFQNKLRFISAGSPNPRLFETILSGGFPLIDSLTFDRSICSDLMHGLTFFTSAIDAYTSFTDLNCDERYRQVMSLQEQVMTTHLYKNRILEIGRVVEELS
jgi:spore maturation protein CgeB